MREEISAATTSWTSYDSCSVLSIGECSQQEIENLLIHAGVAEIKIMRSTILRPRFKNLKKFCLRIFFFIVLHLWFEECLWSAAGPWGKICLKWTETTLSISVTVLIWTTFCFLRALSWYVAHSSAVCTNSKFWWCLIQAPHVLNSIL